FLLWTRYVAIPFQNGSGHSLGKIDIEYEWKPPHCDTCKIFDHTDEYFPKKPKTTILKPVTDDDFVGVTLKGKGKHAYKPRDIDGVRVTKPKPNYFYRLVGKSMNVDGEASTSQPKEMTHTNTQLFAKKVSLKYDDINIISFKNSFDTLTDQDDMFETDKSAWQNNNNIENNVNEIDSEEVENGFVKDNGKPMDGLIDDARKKVEAPPKKTLRKTGIWSSRKRTLLKET
nr:hypothetical protein [Tanacetum cinerariifolium]